MLTVDWPQSWRSTCTWNHSYVQDWQGQIWSHSTELEPEVCHGLDILQLAVITFMSKKLCIEWSWGSDRASHSKIFLDKMYGDGAVRKRDFVLRHSDFSHNGVLSFCPLVLVMLSLSLSCCALSLSLFLLVFVLVSDQITSPNWWMRFRVAY